MTQFLVALFAIASVWAVVFPAAPILGIHRPQPLEAPAAASPNCRVALTLEPYDAEGGDFGGKHELCAGGAAARTSAPFTWGGATWELVFFPRGHRPRDDHRLQLGADSSGGTTTPSVYLRLTGDSRPRPLPRGVSFTVTAREIASGRVVARRTCVRHVFSLPGHTGLGSEAPASRTSWGFAQFCPAGALERGSINLEVGSAQFFFGVVPCYVHDSVHHPIVPIISSRPSWAPTGRVRATRAGTAAACWAR